MNEHVYRPQIGVDRIERLNMWVKANAEISVTIHMSGGHVGWGEITVDQALDVLLESVGF